MVENSARCSRRGLIAMGLGVGLMPGAVSSAWAAAAATPPDLSFAVFRKGDRIGTHAVRFLKEGSVLSARSEINLTVKLAFITVFSYRQTAEDRWQNGNLISANYETLENGTETVVQARADGSKLVVDGPMGTVRPSIGTMSDVCFWNKAIVLQKRLIDSQTGEMATMDQEGALGMELVDVAGRMVEAEHFRLAANKGRGGEVWYDKSGRLVQAVIQTRGETLDYRALA